MNIASKTVLMNLSGSTAGVTTLTGSVDCKGFSYAQILVVANSTAAVHTTSSNNALEESDDSTASFVAISAAASGTGYTPTTNTVASTGPKIIYNVDLRGRKRYLKVTAGLAATATGVGLIAHLTKGADAPSSTTEQGASYAANV